MGTLFGEPIKEADPRLEAIRFLREKKLPFVIVRELMPATKHSKAITETIPIKDMLFDEMYVNDIEKFIKRNSIDIGGVPVEDLTELLNSSIRAEEEGVVKDDDGELSDTEVD